MTYLYLSDGESRQVLTAVGVLIVRPMVPQPPPDTVRVEPCAPGHFPLCPDAIVHAVAPFGRLAVEACCWHMAPHWRPGDVVAGKEAWTQYPIDWPPQPEDARYRADGWKPPTDDPLYRWRSPAVMPDWAVRHRLRVVQVECRQVGGISVKEALETGAPVLKGMQINNGKEPIRRVRHDWEQRFGKRAPWPEGWAWFTWFEACK